MDENFDPNEIDEKDENKNQTTNAEEPVTDFLFSGIPFDTTENSTKIADSADAPQNIAAETAENSISEITGNTLDAEDEIEIMDIQDIMDEVADVAVNTAGDMADFIEDAIFDMFFD